MEMTATRWYLTSGPDAMMIPNDVATRAMADGDDVIRIDAGVRHQPIVGFGASMTDSSAYLLHEVLDARTRDAVMRELFDPVHGAGLSVLRNPMGASDYARCCYSYDDMPAGRGDDALEHFTLEHDERDIIPLVRQAIALNPDLFVMASPWSAPAWMKDSGTMKGGRLLPEHYAAYARYFVRFVQGYRDHGITVAAVTVQNEPLYEPTHYPSMGFPARSEAAFIHGHLRPAFDRAGLDTAILAYDHNWDRPDYPLEVLGLAGGDVDGIAWHWYAGDPAAQDMVAARYPDVPMYFTEGSGGSWIPGFRPAFEHLMRQAIGALRHGARTFVLWNVALDEHNGPTVPGFGRSTCRGLFAVDTRTGAASPTVDYHGLSHFSRVIRPGAVRVDSGDPEGLMSVAALNRDGSIGCVLWNDSGRGRRVIVTCDGLRGSAVDVPAGAACSLLFEGGARR